MSQTKHVLVLPWILSDLHKPEPTCKVLQKQLTKTEVHFLKQCPNFFLGESGLYKQKKTTTGVWSGAAPELIQNKVTASSEVYHYEKWRSVASLFERADLLFASTVLNIQSEAAVKIRAPLSGFTLPSQRSFPSTMRPWLLLLSLLVSDLSPLGDGDGVMENYSWSLYRKLLLNGQMGPRGPETLRTQTEHCCVFIQRSCVYVAAQHKQRTSPSFLWAFTVHADRGCCSPHQEVSGIIPRKHTPALVWLSALVWTFKNTWLLFSWPCVLTAVSLLITRADISQHFRYYPPALSLCRCDRITGDITLTESTQQIITRSVTVRFYHLWISDMFLHLLWIFRSTQMSL